MSVPLASAGMHRGGRPCVEPATPGGDDDGRCVALCYHPCMSVKTRLSATVDADLIEAAEAAVARGQAGSVSAWVNDALRLKLEQERRLAALAGFVAAFEAEHGTITADELRLAARRSRARAVVVRGARAAATARPGPRRRPQ